MTFVHVSVSQYMAYSTARKHALGGIDQGDQIDQAKRHYSELRNKFFKPNSHAGNPGDWFKIPHALDEGNAEGIGFSVSFDEAPESDRDLFYGAGFPFTSNIVMFRIPFLMDNGSPPNIQTVITAFLGREPSKAECREFFNNSERGDQIENKYYGLGYLNLMPGFDGEAVKTDGGDNGC